MRTWLFYWQTFSLRDIKFKALVKFFKKVKLIQLKSYIRFVYAYYFNMINFLNFKDAAIFKYSS